MKNKFLTFTIIFITILSCIFCASGCAKGGTAQATLLSSTEKAVLIKIEKTDKSPTLENVLNSLIGNSFSYEASGTLITKVNGVENKNISSTANSSSGYSWMLFTTDTTTSDASFGSTTYNETTFYGSGYGFKDLKVKAGCYYLLKYEYYNYNW